MDRCRKDYVRTWLGKGYVKTEARSFKKIFKDLGSSIKHANLQKENLAL